MPDESKCDVRYGWRGPFTRVWLWIEGQRKENKWQVRTYALAHPFTFVRLSWSWYMHKYSAIPTISAIIFLRFLLLLLVRMMSRTKRQKYAELRKSTTLKESHSNEAIKFATITLFEIGTTAWLGFLKSQLLNWILSVGKGIKNMRKLCTLSISRGGGGEFFYPIKGPRKIFPRSTSSSENNTWFYFFPAYFSQLYN